MDLNNIHEQQARRLHTQGNRNGIRGGLVLMAGTGAVLAATNQPFIEAHQQAIEGVGLGATALGALIMIAASIRHHQAATIERRIEDQYASE